MKTKIIVILLLFTVKVSFSQVSGNVYTDAITLYNNLYTSTDVNRVNNAEKILNYYSNSSPQSISTIINGNSFFTTDRELINLAIAKAAVVGTSYGSATGAGDAILGFNVATYADGIAKFLIERGKEEISVAFFNRMQSEFTKFPELKYLFPNTWSVVKDIQNSNINTLLQELRDAFEKDLVNTPKNVLSIRSINPSTECPASEPSCNTRLTTLIGAVNTNTVAFSLLLMEGLTTGQNVFSTLNTINSDPQFCSQTTVEINYLKFTALLLEGFRSDSDREGLLISGSKLRSLFNSPEQLNLFLGILFQKFRNQPCYSGLVINAKNLETLLTSIKTSASNFYNSFNSFDNLNAAYQSLKSAKNNGGDVKSALADYLSSACLSISYSFKSLTSVAGVNPYPITVQSIVDNIAIGSDLCIDIHKRNYAGIYGDVIRLIDKNSLVPNQEVRQKLVKYLSFAANMASAKSSDEVKAAIEAIALPPGSFSVKQRSSWNISLNCYVGYGWDFRSGSLFGRSVYAPIGFAFSKGLGKKSGGAVTIFASVVDVGSVVSYRLANGSADTLKQEIRLESIISPSAQLVLAVPKLPLSIAAGWRQTSRLIYDGKKSFSIINPQNVLNLSILIDIPILNIWTRPYE